MKGRNHKIRTSAPKLTTKQADEQARALSRQAALARWYGSEQQPESHVHKLDLPPGVYRCLVCGHVGEPVRRAGLGDAFFGSRRWCHGLVSVIERCHADLGQHGEVVRDESGGG